MGHLLLPFLFLLIAGLSLAVTSTQVRHFFTDDPISKEPPPRPVGTIRPQNINPLADFYGHTFTRKGERNTKEFTWPSQGVNTLGEVPDGAWFTNRHELGRPMSRDALIRGPHDVGPPDKSAPWTIIAAKVEGITPGFTIRDGKGRKYFIKVDPASNPEMATGADVIGARFLYAMGYNVPENYIVNFTRDQLVIAPDVRFRDQYGQVRPLVRKDLERLIDWTQHNKPGHVRAVASAMIPGEGVGNFRFYSRRGDDPNELAPHEHLRVLRGLYVPAAWLNHTDAKALNTYDTVVEENSVRFIRHYLLDFGSAFGSDAVRPKDPRLGHRYMIEGVSSAVNLGSLGFYVPSYARVDFPDFPAVGNFTAEVFEPGKWKTNYPNPAFDNRLAGDEYWAAKKVVAFSDDDIRAIVSAAEFSDPEAAATMARVLIERRDKIARALLTKVPALENIRIENHQLLFDDLAARFANQPSGGHSIQWAYFNNPAGRLQPIPGSTGRQVPPSMASAPHGEYFAAIIRNNTTNKSLTAYFRRETDWKLVGIDREGENLWEP